MAKENRYNSRMRALISHYLRLLVLFLLQKPLFMLYAGSNNDSYSPREWLNVVLHGIGIDLSVAAYLTFIPLLLVLTAIWIERFPLKKVWAVYDSIAALTLSLVFMGDCALYPFWGYKLDASVFMYLSTPKEAFASISLWATILGFAGVIVIALLIRRFLVKPIRPTNEPFHTVLMRIPVTFLYLLLALPLTIAARGGLKESTMNVGHAYFSNDQFLNHSAVNPAFSLLSSISKSDNYAQWYEYFDEDKRNSLFEGLYHTSDSNTVNLLNTTRPNILVCVLEGFGGVFVDAISGQKDITPRLDSLIKEGVFFSNCYAGSFRTDRGLVCIMNGHPGLPQTSIMKLPSKSAALPSLASKLSKSGYSTHFMYGGDINFTNMRSWLYGTGYKHLISDMDFSVSQRHHSSWGVTDEVSFDRLLYDIRENKDSLWFRSYLSLSSHEPFEVPYSKFENKIFNSFAYTDSCMGEFVDSLKRLPVWDNLLMMIIPDHGFRYMTQGVTSDPHIHHIPVVWIGGAVKEPMVFDSFTAQSDMAATILAQMGIGHEEFFYSRNVLSDSYSYPFAFYTFNNGFCFMDSTGVTLYDDDASRCLIEDSTGKQERLERGKAILQTLYDDLDAR